jgi:hypothetical protein
VELTPKPTNARAAGMSKTGCERSMICVAYIRKSFVVRQTYGAVLNVPSSEISRWAQINPKSISAIVSQEECLVDSGVMFNCAYLLSQFFEFAGLCLSSQLAPK